MNVHDLALVPIFIAPDNVNNFSETLDIPGDALPHIFDRFYKANQQGDQSNGSMGLGLAIARRIVELHSGEISVVSVERQGTRFHFDLPAQARAA